MFLDVKGVYNYEYKFMENVKTISQYHFVSAPKYKQKSVDLKPRIFI